MQRTATDPADDGYLTSPPPQGTATRWERQPGDGEDEPTPHKPAEAEPTPEP
ncbi:hypothetical protein GGC64_006240 [Mycobacterium sp. OAS707]|uniref:hypothetical protein n=1 Tax=Mycobacterium sp. OAS707 TaxID=2663822 RepID=UPI0017898F2B|nr:hypothetical protein [Mycobacterium sp. OAS707]MBE1552153.1 hypothetical protein [Mycobacterium sp. OAS707]